MNTRENNDQNDQIRVNLKLIDTKKGEIFNLITKNNSERTIKREIDALMGLIVSTINLIEAMDQSSAEYPHFVGQVRLGCVILKSQLNACANVKSPVEKESKNLVYLEYYISHSLQIHIAKYLNCINLHLGSEEEKDESLVNGSDTAWQRIFNYMYSFINIVHPNFPEYNFVSKIIVSLFSLYQMPAHQLKESVASLIKKFFLNLSCLFKEADMINGAPETLNKVQKSIKDCETGCIDVLNTVDIVIHPGAFLLASLDTLKKLYHFVMKEPKRLEKLSNYVSERLKHYYNHPFELIAQLFLLATPLMLSKLLPLVGAQAGIALGVEAPIKVMEFSSSVFSVMFACKKMVKLDEKMKLLKDKLNNYLNQDYSEEVKNKIIDLLKEIAEKEERYRSISPDKYQEEKGLVSELEGCYKTLKNAKQRLKKELDKDIEIKRELSRVTVPADYKNTSKDYEQYPHYTEITSRMKSLLGFIEVAKMYREGNFTVCTERKKPMIETRKLESGSQFSVISSGSNVSKDKLLKKTSPAKIFAANKNRLFTLKGRIENYLANDEANTYETTLGERLQVIECRMQQNRM